MAGESVECCSDVPGCGRNCCRSVAEHCQALPGLPDVRGGRGGRGELEAIAQRLVRVGARTRGLGVWLCSQRGWSICVVGGFV